LQFFDSTSFLTEDPFQAVQIFDVVLSNWRLLLQRLHALQSNLCDEAWTIFREIPAFPGVADTASAVDIKKVEAPAWIRAD
jgi:hypothetical protein